MRSSIKTWSIEFYSVISVTLTVFNVLLLFGLYLYNHNHFFFLHLMQCCMRLCHMFIKVLTYLLAYLLTYKAVRST